MRTKIKTFTARKFVKKKNNELPGFEDQKYVVFIGVEFFYSLLFQDEERNERIRSLIFMRS